jgi:hypothetical protein
MSIFNFPRINFKGLMMVNVGTANNDDYSSDLFPPGSPYAGQPVRLADSVNVQPLTYGMSDSDWIKWVQEQNNFVDPSSAAQSVKLAMTSRAEGPALDAAQEDGDATVPLIPAEWNFYGSMGMTMIDVNVTGVNDPANSVPATLMTQLKNATLSFNNRPDDTGRSTGMLIDINPEDPSGSQVFTDFLSLLSGDEFLFSGQPTKASTRWINFQRNINLRGPNGAAGTFQCMVPLSQLKGQDILQGMPAQSPDGRALTGIVCQYSMFRSLQPINTYKYQGQAWFDAIINLYKTQGINPSYVQLQGTIAPCYEGDMSSMPQGRYLVPPSSGNIPVPPGSSFNGNKWLSLGAATFQVDYTNNVISLNLTASLPENYQGNYDPMSTDSNSKYDFGTLTLGIQNGGNITPIGPVNYATMANDANGWIFDISFDASLASLIQTGGVVLSTADSGIVLGETPYLIVSDQSSVYAEQDESGTPQSTFLNDTGLAVPISFNIYKKGVPLTDKDPDTFNLWMYDTTPNQDPGNATLLLEGYKAGQSISIPVPQPGNRLITAVPSLAPPPPSSYANFAMATEPILNIRILPNGKDYSQYYVDPKAAMPVGNASLTFDVIYDEVLRNYYLLYPAMNKHVPLNDPAFWADPAMAGNLAQRIMLENWGNSVAMPRTRDLSQSRRTLLLAWCMKIIQG